MKNRLLLVLMVITTYNSFSQTPNNWIAETNCPKALSWATSFSIGYNIYVCSGVDSTSLVSSFYKFNTKNNTWTLLAPFPGTPRINATSFAIGGNGYVGLGFNGFGSTVLYNDFYRYDTLTNTWSTAGSVSSFPFSDTVLNAWGFSVNGKGYVCLGGGYSYSGELYPSIFSKYLYEYNPATNTWTAKSPFPGTARCGVTGFVIDSIAYIGTGLSASGTLSDFYSYNPFTNSWSASPHSFPGLSRTSAVGFAICDKGYVGQGINFVSGVSGSLCSDFYQYDPVSNTWSLMNSYPGISSIGMIYAGINAGDTSFGFAGLGTTNASPGATAGGTNSPNYSEFYKYYPPTFCLDTSSSLEVKNSNTGQFQDFKIYPNPIENDVQITCSTNILECQVYDYTGKKLLSFPKINSNSFVIDSRNWNTGIFFIKALTSDGYCVQKIIKK